MFDTDMQIFEDYLKDVKDLATFSNMQQTMKMQREIACRKGKLRRRAMKRRFNPLHDLDEKQFKLRYRFKKENMRRIIELLRDDMEGDASLKKRPNQVPVELQIMAAIRYWGYTEHAELTALEHGVSLKTLNKICKRVSGVLSSKATRFIRMPATFFEKECVTNAFQALAGMPHVIGAVSHHTVQLIGKNSSSAGDSPEEVQRDQVLIQVTTDVGLKIRDIDCRLYGSGAKCHPSDMFTNTRIKERFEQNEFRDRILIGNNSLPCSSFLFTPIIGPNTSEEYIFNQSLADSFRPAVQCLSMLKSRFQILSSDVSSSYSTARNVILALAVLHNMAVDWNDRTVGLELGLCFLPDSFDNQFLEKLSDTKARSEFIKHNF